MAGILEKVFKEPPAEEKIAHKIKHAADDAADAISNLRTELTGEKKVFNEITPEEKAAYTVKFYTDRAADAIGDAREKLGFDEDTSMLRSAEEKFDSAVGMVIGGKTAEDRRTEQMHVEALEEARENLEDARQPHDF